MNEKVFCDKCEKFLPMGKGRYMVGSNKSRCVKCYAKDKSFYYKEYNKLVKIHSGVQSTRSMASLIISRM